MPELARRSDELHIILNLVNNRTLSNNRLRKVKNFKTKSSKTFSNIKFTNNDPQKNSSKDENQKNREIEAFFEKTLKKKED